MRSDACMDTRLVEDAVALDAQRWRWWWVEDAPSGLDKRQRQRQRTVQGSAVCVGDKGRQGRDDGCEDQKDASEGQVPESRWSLVKGTGVCLRQAGTGRASDSRVVVVNGRVLSDRLYELRCGRVSNMALVGQRWVQQLPLLTKSTH